MRTHSSDSRAFSLLDLLAVLFVIGIIAVLVIPHAPAILRGTQLSQAEQILTDQVKLARQMALTKNHSVQVRFIRYGDPEMPGEKANDPATGFYRAIQLMEILDNGDAVPLDKPQWLPQSVIVNAGSLSTLVNDPAMQPPTRAAKGKSANGSGGDPAMARGIDWNYDFVEFRFRPDGSTTLNSNTGMAWAITLHNFNDKPAGANLPANFVTLQIDPVSGTVRLFRPSV